MQEGMLHLGQNLAEKLEHLLPHAWWVLGLAQRAQGLQDLVLQQVLQTWPRLAGCLLPLLID